MSIKRNAGLRRKVELSALEPRMLFDGAALIAWDVSMAPPDAPPPPADTASLVAIVFISPEVANPDAIRQAFGASAEVIQLSNARDGIDQISEALATRSNVGAIHLVSHGAADFISLPGQSLSGAMLDERAAQIAGWASALSADADILVYGCDVASSEGGLALLARLASITGADVAASSNDTGGTLGADWTLEYASGAISASTLFTAHLGDPATYTDRLATINLSGSTGWTAIMIGNGRDPYSDSQAGAADTDIIGDATHASLYTAYDDNGTAGTADDTLVFRMRIDNPTSTTSFGGVAIVGMDANLDGKIDLFFSVDGRNNGQAVRLLDPGTGANLSPSTTSTAPLPTGWLPNNGVYGFTPSTYAVVPVSQASDPNWGPSALALPGSSNSNLTGQGGNDAFISWRVPIVDIATVLAKPSPTDRSGTGPRGTTGIAGYGKDTVVQYISFTQTQTGPINGDLNGVGPNYDKNATFASLGTFTSPMSAANPVPDGLSITISEPIGDGNLAGAPGATEASAVTLSGATKASAGSTVNLVITDSVGGSTTAAASVIAGANGNNTWSVANVNFSALAEGTLNVSASVTSTGATVTDTASVLLDKTAAALSINQLATTTAGKPTLSGATNLPDGSVVTLTLDPDNTPGTANLVYQAIVSGGVWTLNTATATPVSGSLPAAGLSASTKVTATALDAAGNLSTATALNRPTVTSQVTGATLPTVGGAWTNSGGDALEVRLYANNSGVPGALLGTYIPATAGDTWSVNLASATMVGGGSIAPLAADQTYHIQATVTRAGVSVGDTTSAELAIIGGAAIDITDADGANDDIVSTSVAKPVFSGSSSVINGYINLTLDPSGNGTTDQIRYAVATDGAGNWTLDTANPAQPPVAGFMPAAGLSGAVAVTATTSMDASGQLATDTQSLTAVIPTIMIGTSSADKSGMSTTVVSGGAAAIIIVGDGIFNVAEDDSIVISGQTTNLAAGTQVVITISDGTTTYTKTTVVLGDGTFTLAASGAGTANDGNAVNLSLLKNSSLTVTATAASVSALKTVTHDAIAPAIVLTTPSLLKSGTAIATGNIGLPANSAVLVHTSLDLTDVAVTTDANGDFSHSFNIPNGGGGGNVTIFASSAATDAAGNKVAAVQQTVAYQNANASPPSIAIGTITGVGTGDTTIVSGEIGSGVLIAGTVANTSAAGSGTIVITISDGQNTLSTSGANPLTLTRNLSNWSVALTPAQVIAYNNGTLVITAQLTDTFGQGGNAETFIVRDVAQPTLFLVSGTPSITIDQPIDPNGLVNAAEDNALVVKGRTVNAIGGQVRVTISDGDGATLDPTTLVTVGNDGSWTAPGLDVSLLNNGTLTVTATVDPDANPATVNSATTTASVVHDKTGPVLNITAAASVGAPTPFIIGTSAGLGVGATVTVTVDSDRDGAANQTYTTTVLADGSWQVATNVATPVNGIIRASAADAAGNAAAVTATAIAAIASDTGSNASDFITGSRQLTFSGYGELGQNVTLALDGVTIGNAVADPVSGVWSFNHTGTALANGSYSLTATTLVNGNMAISTQQIVIDARAVTITGISADSGASGLDYITNDTTLAFNGTATAGSMVTLALTDSNGNEVLRQLGSATGGVWSVDRSASAPLADGVYALSAAVTDASGVTTTVTQALVVDTRAQIGITTNYKTPDTTPLLSGTSDLEAGRVISVDVAVAGGSTYTYSATVAANGAWSVDTGVAVPAGALGPINYANGSALTISASGSDIAGNFVTTSKAMLIDAAAPTIGITRQLDYTGANTPDGVLVASEDTAVVLRGVTTGVPDGGIVVLSITDGVTTVADSATVTGNAWQLSALNLRNLANGTITVTATYYDGGGTAYSDVATVLHDKTVTGTAVNIDSISTDTAVATDFNTSDNTLVFTGSAAPGSPVHLILAAPGPLGVFDTFVTADAQGSWRYDFQGTALADATYSLTAQVSAGPIASQLVVVDTSAPAGAVSVNFPVLTDDTTPTITGQAMLGAGETLTVSVNGKTYTAGDGQLTLTGSAWTLAIPASDALTPASSSAGFNGVYEVLASITDVAGNVVTDASTGELTVSDLQAPVIDLDPSNAGSINHNVVSANGAAVSLDDGADPMTVVETSDRIPRLTIAISGLAGLDGASEKLIFGANVVAADGSDAGTPALVDVAVGGVRVNITYASGVFTLQRANFAPLNAAEAQAIMRDIAYRNDRGTLATSSVKTVAFGAVDDAGNQAAGAYAYVTVTGSVAAPSQVVAITAITDDVANLTGVVASGAITNDATPGLSGTVSAGLSANERVVVYRDGVRLGEASVSGATWTYADSGLADGANYSYTAQVDNVVTTASGTPSAAYLINVDTSAPSQVVSITAMSRDTGTAGDFITGDGGAGRTVSGTLSSQLAIGESLEVSVDGINWTSATVNGTAWDVTDNAVHTSGWTIQTRIVDVAGNTGGAASRTVTLVGAPAQTVAISAIVDDVALFTGTVVSGGLTNDIAPEVTGSLSAPLGANEVVAIYRNGVRVGDAGVTGTVWTYLDSALADGVSYAYSAVVENTLTAGSGAVSAAYAVTIDASAPPQGVAIVSMTGDSGVPGDFITADGSAGRTLAGTLSAPLATGEVLELSFDGGVSWVGAQVAGTGWTAVDASAHTSGWTVTSRITDSAGNVGGTATRLVTYVAAPSQMVAIATIADDVAPMAGTVANGGSTNDTAPEVSGSLSAALGANEVLAIYRNGVRVGNAGVTGTGWTYLDSALADDVTYAYTAVVENTLTAGSGAVSTAYSVTIDTSVPDQSVAIVSMTGDSGVPGDFITADGSAGRTVAGTLSAPLATGEVLELSFDGGVSWVGAQVTGTSWTAVDASAHTSGWTVTSRITDPAGNVGGMATKSVTYVAAPAQTVAITTIVDDVAPVAGTVANGGVSNDTAPAVSGSLSAPLGANEVVAIYRNGIRAGNAGVTGTEWAYLDSALADGITYAYTAVVENTLTAGSGAVSIAYSVTIDTSAPAQSVAIVSMTGDSGLPGDFITADGSAGRTVEGKLSAPLATGEVLELSFDMGVSWVGAQVTGTNWTAVDASAHTTGWTVSSRITDSAGNVGGMATKSVTYMAAPAQTVAITTIIDDVAPVAGTVANGGVSNDTAPAVSGSISAPLGANEVLAVYRNGVRVGTAGVTGTGWSYFDGALADGATYAYSAVVENALTATSGAASAAYTVTIDASAPAQVVAVVSMTRDTGAPGDFITADGSAGRTVTGTLSGPLATGEVLELSYDGGVSWIGAQVTGSTWSAVDATAHTSGWTVTSRILDPAGNVGGMATRSVTYLAPPLQSVAIAAVVDDVAPLAGIVVNGGFSNDTAPAVSGTLSGPLGANEVIALYRNGARIGVAAVSGNAWTYADSALASGASYAYTAVVENPLTGAAGGSSALYVVTIDTSAPAQSVTVVSMTNDTGTDGDFVTADGGAGRTLTGTLSGVLLAGEVLEVSNDGGLTWTAATVSGTGWLVVDTSSHVESWTISTRLRDAAGNTATGATRSVVLDAGLGLEAPLQVSPAPAPMPMPVLSVDTVAPPAPGETLVPAETATLTLAVPVASADETQKETSMFVRGEPLVSVGVPPPAMFPSFLFAQGAAPRMVFDIDPGNTAFGAANSQVLSGTDIGAGFLINVRQNDGSSGKDVLRLVSASVIIETGLQPESDLLALSITSPNITAVYDAATGVLSLSGLATAAEYEQVIQGVKLRDADGGDVKDKRTIRFTIRAESGQTQTGVKQYRGPESGRDVTPARPGERPADDKADGKIDGKTKQDKGALIGEGKPGLMSQIATAHAKQNEGRDRLVALAGRHVQAAQGQQ